MKAKISEIFGSIQGEGKYVGTRQVFVRFFGCPMRCVWCDTPLSIGDDPSQTYEEYTVAEVVEKIKAVKGQATSLSLTGGEPLLQTHFIKRLIPELKKEGLRMYLESSGTLYQALQEIVDQLDIIAMDIKLPSSTRQRPYWGQHARFLQIARQRDVFVKVVVSLTTTAQDMIRACDLVAAEGDHILFVIQPNDADPHQEVMRQCLDYYDLCQARLTHVRLIPQVHKFMKVR